jgi:hypothetical protein
VQPKTNAFKRFSESWWPVLILAVLVNVLAYQRYNHVQRSAPNVVEKGAVVASLSVLTLDGQKGQVNWAGTRPTVLYVFRPDCIWCARNFNSLRTLHGDTRYRFIALSLAKDGVREYLSTNGTPMPTYIATSETARTLKLGITPETIVVSPQGVVERVWPGAYTGPVKKDVEVFFDVELPEIADAQVSPRP